MQTYDRDIVFNKIMRVLNALLKAIVIVIFIFPFYWMVSTSLKDLTEALQFPPTLIPKKSNGKTSPMCLRWFPLQGTLPIP